MIARMLALVAVLVAGWTWSPPAAAQAVNDQTILVNRAANTLERLLRDPTLHPAIIDKLARARAVLIVPDLVKAGFLVGGEYGSGVLLARTQGGWSGPAFYTVSSASFGFQIGAQDAETLFVIMSEGGLDAVMNNRMKLGANAGIAVAVMGAGASASTTTHAGADIYAFNNAVGLYGGLSLEGSAILPRPGWNAAYYRVDATPRDILFARRVDNPQANRLRDLLVAR